MRDAQFALPRYGSSTVAVGTSALCVKQPMLGNPCVHEAASSERVRASLGARRRLARARHGGARGRALRHPAPGRLALGRGAGERDQRTRPRRASETADRPRIGVGVGRAVPPRARRPGRRAPDARDARRIVVGNRRAVSHGRHVRRRARQRPCPRVRRVARSAARARALAWRGARGARRGDARRRSGRSRRPASAVASKADSTGWARRWRAPSRA